MAQDTSVKFFLSSQSDILPALSGTAGALLSVLRACLKTGAGAINVDTITVTGGIAVVNTPSAHKYLPGQVALIAGATPNVLNGEHRILSVPTSTSFTVAVEADDGTATGTITAKLAPAGFEEAFTGTNVAAFRSLHEDAPPACVRIDDTANLYARVVAYMDMEDVDTGTDPFPLSSQLSGGLYWPKANNTTGTRTWAVFSDGRTFYLYVQPTSASISGIILGFGELDESEEGDWRVFVSGQASASYTGGAGCLSIVGTTGANTLTMPRGPGGADTSTLGYLVSPLRSSGISGNSAGSAYSAFPDPVKDILLAPAYVVAGGLRGRLPGLFHTPQGAVGWVTPLDRNLAPGFMPVTTYSGSVSGLAFLQTHGMWRAA